MTDSEFLGMVLLFLLIAFVMALLLVDLGNGKRKP